MIINRSAGDGLAFDDIVIERDVPDIGVEQPAGTGLSDGIDVIDFSEVAVGSDSTLNFTVRNTGSDSLDRPLGQPPSAGQRRLELQRGIFRHHHSLPRFFHKFQSLPFRTFHHRATPRQPPHRQQRSGRKSLRPGSQRAGCGNAEIGVEHPVRDTDLSDGVSSVDFGSATPVQTVPRTFTIRNHGTSDLTQLAASVDRNPRRRLLGRSARSTTTLGPGIKPLSFDVNFSPNGGGSRTAVLRIASNDVDENPFDVDLTGHGLDPGGGRRTTHRNGAGERVPVRCLSGRSFRARAEI